MSIRVAVPEDASAIGRVHVDSWRTTYQGLLPDSMLDNLSVEQREASWRQQIGTQSSDAFRGCVFVADDSHGQLVGFASGGSGREQDLPFEAELYAIYLLHEHQGQGTRRALTNRVVDYLRRHGHDSMRVWVLKGNPAEAFYERLGGKPVGHKTIT
ncbi:MAG: GNAT family N-acetyltransferase [Trueperaceae bacterium]